MMSSNTHKNQFQSLSSLSLEHNLKNLRDSQLFPRQQRKSSFDLINFHQSQPNSLLQRRQLEKSLDLLNSSLNINKLANSPRPNFLQFTEDDRQRLAQAGLQPEAIDQINSQSESYQFQEPAIEEQPVQVESILPEVPENCYTLVQYLPQELSKLLVEKQVPMEYVRGLLRVRQQGAVKSVRRLKVERYLQKRRRKTWDKKICYNCRQKVAEERLRIKGKFIKKRRAMQILGLTTPIGTSEIKQLLEEMLKDKTLREIEEIIRQEE